ncbi:ABC transporter ATP-binding protein [Azospirillum sp. YIM B02556]|uniref:ABC transporter ATP-binding protein n=1 Tax=Azospirillum endophyticum TaxID=2800326 RepID=A0ABS1F815_9PROT|nr:ABC transporter ATP-binding protein [Azospirillum endophyticum]MBK1839551.1 ABC transporter ATP-binding protein [Azospirillum endophyticum]
MTVGSTTFKQLHLQGVRREFDAFTALKGLDLTVERGEFIALLGPSGCGKTTALNCIAGLLPVSGGRIMLDDRRVDVLRPEERGFGMVFQNYALFPHMTVRKNIGFGLRMRGVPKPELEKRVDAALAAVRLESQAQKLPGQLSGGQQQRVAIARAIVVEPPLVLMDEPLSNLDAKLRLEMRQEIRRIHQSLGSTTIYVTHDQEEALSLADRIVVLRDGAIRQVGTPAELYALPAHLDVADFMGFRNRVDGELVGMEGENALLDIEGTVIRGRMRTAPAGGAAAGKAAVAAIRPDDLEPTGTADGIPVRVEAVEYRGRGFHGVGVTASGTELHFASPHPLERGAAIRLGADAGRVLVFGDAR